ncbi:integrin alpha-M-like [Poeciliopsis prolifica]|uniref:integrin alpha-M-like n=1 Tax=Poeciliopsis prolifica TaxID=188132 RepID=UPI0024142C57|nr:integrin alpha-M-like [Poeciliopsis prolifica]
MDWIITLALFCSVLKTAVSFNVDSGSWTTLSQDDESFGYQVVQRQSDVLVSAPLHQYEHNKKGQIYRCNPRENRCSSLPALEERAAVNMSLGLAMANDPSTQKTMICGPTIPRDCTTITMSNGLCYEIDRYDTIEKSYPSATEECRTQADIAFLLDGSGSVVYDDFIKMKEFVKNLIRTFQGRDTQFAITQFATDSKIEYDFNTFNTSNWETQINRIRQLAGKTYTAKGIQNVVNDVFSPQKGSRPNVKRILIVITDGESTDPEELPTATQLADKKKIARFVIGVGDAFKSTAAKKELRTIASADNFVFEVDSFGALDEIRNNLHAKIFSIEGSQGTGATLKQEMSQEGFRAAYVSGYIQMTMVGANQWKGGYKKYLLSNVLNTVSFEPSSIETDSYLGYSMAFAKTNDVNEPLTILGAPRNKHKGVVMTVFREQLRDNIRPREQQTGEYFGAEVCAMDVDADGVTDLILISSPMYKDVDREGRVYVCKLRGLDVVCYFNNPSQITTLRGDVSVRGRFGSSLAVLPDINADTFNDLAIGAPLENDGQGSIYIFQGEGRRKINPTYSQRIAASAVQSGLKFFGISISQSSYDQSGDGLPDLAVGSKGKVVLLRSRPVVSVTATVSFNPNPIPTQNPDCSKPLPSKATVCFTMSKLSNVNEAQAQVNFTLTLDTNRQKQNSRAEISKDVRHKSGSVHLKLNKKECVYVHFFIKPCPDDYFNPLNNELRFTFDGLVSDSNPRPSLSPKVQTTTSNPLSFKANCGIDKVCEDNLKMDFNFTTSSVVKFGIDKLLNVTVFVENRGENSYNSHIVLTYPVGLSYRKVTSEKGRIECNSVDSEDGVTKGKTVCSIDKPIFRSNSAAIFIVSYGFNTNSDLSRKIEVTVNAASDNEHHSHFSEVYKNKDIDVKYSVFIAIESSLSYNNFTFGENAVQKPLEQKIKVFNAIRPLNFTVVLKVPVKLGDKDIWVDMSSFQIPGCQSSRDEEPTDTDFVNTIKEKKILDCTVAKCRVFRCSEFMGKDMGTTYNISANISSGWIEQIGLSSAKFLLTSTASLEYDESQYIFFSTASNSDPPVHKIEAEIEVFPKPDFTKEIIGGSLGGLAILILLTVGLYKAGFFKSKYNEMINDNAGPEGDALAEG